MIATRKLQPYPAIFNKPRVTYNTLTFATFYRSESIIRTFIIGNHCIPRTIAFSQPDTQSFAMPKEKNYNPVQAQRKADKAKALKKGKAIAFDASFLSNSHRQA